MKLRFKVLIFIVCLFFMSNGYLFSEQEESAQKVTLEEMPKDVGDMISGCKTFDDYEKAVSEIKNLIEKSGYENIDVLYYALAEARFGELMSLSKDNTIESGRLYISLSAQYYDEALTYLDKASLATKSNRLLSDIYFLKFLIFKQRFQPQKADAVFNDLVNRISQYTNDPILNRNELLRLSDKFAAYGFGDLSIKLKIAYASKVGGEGAKDIFEDIKKSADQRFAQGKTKEADVLYDRYAALAQPYFKKDEMAASIMEIAEKYYAAERYKQARHYYELYTDLSGDLKLSDYCSYRTSLCFYYEKDYAKAITQLANFMALYQNSVWFDKSFETLGRLYYENLSRDEAINELRNLIGRYYRKNVGDYAYILSGLLYYGNKDYRTALDEFKKVGPDSSYFFTAQTLINDIEAIKGGREPSFSTESADTYKIWDPDKPITGELVPEAKEGISRLEVKKLAQVRFELKGLGDLDRFSEYMQDKEDQSRLPKKMEEREEKDLLSLQWFCDGGKFLDQQDPKTRTWQAPEEIGVYTVSLHVDDLGLVRVPDKGIKKDSAKELSVTIQVKD